MNSIRLRFLLWWRCKDTVVYIPLYHLRELTPAKSYLTLCEFSLWQLIPCSTNFLFGFITYILSEWISYFLIVMMIFFPQLFYSSVFLIWNCFTPSDLLSLNWKSRINARSFLLIPVSRVIIDGLGVSASSYYVCIFC